MPGACRDAQGLSASIVRQMHARSLAAAVIEKDFIHSATQDNDCLRRLAMAMNRQLCAGDESVEHALRLVGLGRAQVEGLPQTRILARVIN